MPRLLTAQPLLHSTTSSFENPLTREIRNELQIEPATFVRILKLLDKNALDEEQLEPLLKQRGEELRATCLAHLEKNGWGQDSVDAMYRKGLNFGSVRVVLRQRAYTKPTSELHVYEYRRYSLKYVMDKDKSDSVVKELREKNGVYSTYVVSIGYSLIQRRRRSSGKSKDYFGIECRGAATQIHGESGSPFSAVLEDQQAYSMENLLSETYRAPYSILERILSAFVKKKDLTALTRGPLNTEPAFSLRLTNAQMEDRIRIQTLGFRWIVVPTKSSRNDPRHMLLFLMNALYSSSKQFLNGVVGVKHNFDLVKSSSRKSSSSLNAFEHAEKVHVLSGEAKRLLLSDRKGKDDPLTSLRFTIRDNRRMNLYSVSLHIPSLPYMKRLYSHTDAVDRSISGAEHTRRLKLWKSAASEGLVIGVDAYTGYLRDKRHISTLSQLLLLFRHEYGGDFSKFCKRVFDTAMSDLDMPYWLSTAWVKRLKHHNVEKEDKQVFDYLWSNKTATLIEALRHVKLISSRKKLSKEELRTCVQYVKHCRREYGYDPSYSWATHYTVLEAWYLCDDPKAYYEQAKQTVVLDEKIKYVRKLFTKGLGKELKDSIDIPSLSTPPLHSSI